MDNTGDFLKHTACLNPLCGSSDARAVYTDGHSYCFSCRTYFNADGSKKEGEKIIEDNNFVQGNSLELNKRGITKDTCEKFKYQIGSYKGVSVQIANYYNKGSLVAQHLRLPNKEFRWLGDLSEAELFGQGLWRSENGKRIVITEGEIDAMSISQAFNNRWAVVSIPSGSTSAKKYLKKHLEFLESYNEIVLAFDNDEAGRKAIEECVLLFSAGKVKVANWGAFKDANEMTQAGKEKEIATVIFEAKVYRPDGIILGDDLSLDYLVTEESILAFDTPYPLLNTKMRGVRKGEITLLTAGSGIGKSTLAREIGYHLSINHNLKIGAIALEENIKKTALGFMAIDMNVPLGDLYLNRKIVDEKMFEDSYKRVVANKRLYLYDHFGSLESQNLINKIKYLAISCEVDFIIIDHLSIVVSGIEDGDERRIIDNLMTHLRSLVENTGIGMIAICHLKIPEGTPHEEGGRVTLSQLRGSGSLKQLSDNIIAMERNQQGEEPNVSRLRLLKCRLFGENVGLADLVKYNSETGRLLTHEVSDQF